MSTAYAQARSTIPKHSVLPWPVLLVFTWLRVPAAQIPDMNEDFYEPLDDMPLEGEPLESKKDQ